MAKPPAKRTKNVGEEARVVICKTFHYLKKEFQNMKEHDHDTCDLSPLSNIGQRVCEATGVSKRNLRKMLSDERRSAVTSSKKLITKKQFRRLHMPYLDMTSRIANAIRATMHGIIENCSQNNEKAPTWDSLTAIFRDTIGYDGSDLTLRSILVSMGYRWYLGKDDKRSVIEKHNIQFRRFKFLKDIARYRSQNRTIVYTAARLLHRDLEEGKCLTVLCAATPSGWLPNTVWIYTAPATIDFEYNINSSVYKSWVDTYLLPNLPPNSVVVVNDVHYNNKQCTIPTKKEQLLRWLEKHNIPCDKDLHRIEVLDLVIRNKDKLATYTMDEYISQTGRLVLRLPPIHPELNLVEVAFETIKSEIRRGAEENLETPWRIVKDAVEKVGPHMWSEFFEILKKVELEYLGYFETDQDQDITIKVIEEDDDEGDIDEDKDYGD